MATKKMNNLFAYGRKAALLVFFLGLTFGQAEFYKALYKLEESKTEAYNEKLEEGQEKKKNKGYYPLLGLCGIVAVMWTGMYLIARKMPKEELRKCEKSFTL